jgi:type IV pilus assembly protein PilZ
MAEAKDEELRHADRAPITLRVEYKRINTFFADYTKNISKGGTFIRTARPLDVGTEFMFVLSLPETVQLELKGMGIQFVFADDGQREAVEKVVTGMMHEALGPVLANKLLRGRA